MSLILLSTICIGQALLIAVLLIAIIKRRVPMNRLYGIRFAHSFRSEEDWYDVNEKGGKIMLKWLVPILGFGVVGLFLPDSAVNAYGIVMPFLLLCCVIGGAVHSYFATR